LKKPITIYVFMLLSVALLPHETLAQSTLNTQKDAETIANQAEISKAPNSSENNVTAGSYVKSSAITHGDWKITCPESENCRMAQSIVTTAGKQIILQMRIFKGKDGAKPTALFSFPLGILLNTGWQIKVDNGKSQLLPFEICRVEGCFAGIQLPDRLLNSFKRGNTLHVKFFDSQQNPVEPKISLAGFTKAWGELK